MATLDNSVFVVGLVNGHRLHGHLDRSQKKLANQVRVGGVVTVQLTPCDLSQGKVILTKDKL